MSITVLYLSMFLFLSGSGQANQHLAGLGAVVVDALVGERSAVERVAGLQDGLLGVGLQGHLAGHDVVDGLQGIVAELAAAAGQEVAQAHDDLSVIDVGRIVQTGGQHIVVAGSGISSSLILAGDFVAHLKKLPFVFYCWSHSKTLMLLLYYHSFYANSRAIASIFSTFDI